MPQLAGAVGDRPLQRTNHPDEALIHSLDPDLTPHFFLGGPSVYFGGLGGFLVGIKEPPWTSIPRGLLPVFPWGVTDRALFTPATSSVEPPGECS